MGNLSELSIMEFYAASLIFVNELLILSLWHYQAWSNAYII